ncbi:S-methylmethionine--homocysteine S-methyltransferase BHMT2 [Portunus trituberculatus]|uniref:S-methylmethionine--homocysteine S-methyltransferase BHMT2 n=1 Tax=Portunus trituberculatus TaxID=210409 RepID=A0A5B7ITC4_PORTR|nr:S-methylmethionine--homocysteine S-methyltransferase BHMT2 [Portunus trituberculatus]
MVPLYHGGPLMTDVKQLHREFLRAGSDVIQTVTYNGSQEKLNKALGNDALTFFFHVEEIEWAIEEAAKTGMVVVATMAISVKGDGNGIPAGECAVRMAKAGAQVGENIRT